MSHVIQTGRLVKQMIGLNILMILYQKNENVAYSGMVVLLDRFLITGECIELDDMYLKSRNGTCRCVSRSEHSGHPSANNQFAIPEK